MVFKNMHQKFHFSNCKILNPNQISLANAIWRQITLVLFCFFFPLNSTGTIQLMYLISFILHIFETFPQLTAPAESAGKFSMLHSCMQVNFDSAWENFVKISTEGRMGV